MSLLEPKSEALLSLGIAATVGCDSCMSRHIQDAFDAGATEADIRQTIDLARHIGGKPAADCCATAEELLGGMR